MSILIDPVEVTVTFRDEEVQLTLRPPETAELLFKWLELLETASNEDDQFAAAKILAQILADTAGIPSGDAGILLANQAKAGDKPLSELVLEVSGVGALHDPTAADSTV